MFSQDIFVSLSQVDGLYFVCNIDDFKFLADMIQHIPLNLRSRYVFCTAPLNRKEPFVCTTLLKVSYCLFFRKCQLYFRLSILWCSEQLYLLGVLLLGHLRAFLKLNSGREKQSLKNKETLIQGVSLSATQGNVGFNVMIGVKTQLCRVEIPQDVIL